MRVQIDQARKQRRPGKIDDSICLFFTVVRTGGDDPLALDANGPALMAPFAVKYGIRP